MIRVLIVDDSATQRYVMAKLIQSVPDMAVAGQAGDGEEAIAMTERLRPDVISMDVRMPRLDGLGATQRIMDRFPTPIVVVSTAGKGSEAMALLEAGAVAAVEKLPQPSDPRYREYSEEILKMLRLMAGVRVIRRWKPTRPPASSLRSGLTPTAPLPVLPATITASSAPPQILAIGASAGGPGALTKVLGALSADFPIPIVVVQHLSSQFMPNLAEFLDRACALKVKLAAPGELPQPGTVYLAPGDHHLRIGADRRLVLDSKVGSYRHCPAVDAMFLSVAGGFAARAIGVILTGMGDDGAQGMRAMRSTGARTIAQDEDSCVVFGMPAAAIALGAAEFVLPLESIGSALLSLTSQKEAL